MFDGDGNFYLGPPPDSYLDAEMAVDVSRLAWEFDEWGKSEIGHGPFIQSQDRRVSIQDGRTLLVFVSNSENLESMLQELAPLQVDVVASIEDRISAWVSLASINDLKSLTHVSYVYFEDMRFVCNSASNHFVSSALVSSDLASSRQVVASQAALHANAADWSPKLSQVNYLNAGGQRSAGGGTTVDASVSIDLNATDLSRNAITKIQAGEEFFVTGSAKELNGRMIYGAYADVLLSRGLQVVNVESLSSNANSPNRLQNLGGLSLDSTQADNSLGLFTLRVRAIETGVASIKTHQASSKLNGAAYVAGLDKALDSTRVKFGTLNLMVFGKIDNRQESGEESMKFELGSLI